MLDLYHCNLAIEHFLVMPFLSAQDFVLNAEKNLGCFHDSYMYA